jgi:hypothetical protein
VVERVVLRRLWLLCSGEMTLAQARAGESEARQQPCTRRGFAPSIGTRHRPLGQDEWGGGRQTTSSCREVGDQATLDDSYGSWSFSSLRTFFVATSMTASFPFESGKAIQRPFGDQPKTVPGP